MLCFTLRHTLLFSVTVKTTHAQIELLCCQLQKDMAVLSDCIISDYGMRIKVGLNTNRSTERTYCRGEKRKVYQTISKYSFTLEHLFL